MNIYIPTGSILMNTLETPQTSMRSVKLQHHQIIEFYGLWDAFNLLNWALEPTLFRPFDRPLFR